MPEKNNYSHEIYYSELCCISNFSFHRGASNPHELVERAAALGYRALALTDECSMAGAVQALQAAEAHHLHLILGSRFALADDVTLIVLARHDEGYTQLCRLITQARRKTTKGQYALDQHSLEAQALDDCWLLVLPAYDQSPSPTLRALLGWLATCHPNNSRIALALHQGARDAAHTDHLYTLRAWYGLPIVAVGDVHMHSRGRRALQDVFTALRLKTTVAQTGRALAANGERYLRPLDILGTLYPADALAETQRIAQSCTFNLRNIRYDYPAELVPAGQTSSEFLREKVEKGLATRWPDGVSFRIRRQIIRELRMIDDMNYPHYFLTVHDIVAYARCQGILCQGRGSSANSVVCYCLGITEVDPTQHELLFERFISKERDEPPDIDVDFEHERREEVIQYIYGKYGRRRAALAATVIRYRPRSAMRDVGRAMGLSADQIDVLAGELSQRRDDGTLEEQLAARGVSLDATLLHQILVLVDTLLGFPRHLSQHVGGFVLSQQPLEELVPVENAAMVDRTIIQWDKDDLEAVGLMKIDVLALGMLSCIRRCFDLIAGYTGYLWRMATIPGGDQATYDMISSADTVGVFQIESRAQMSMLPRLRPQQFFDLVVEVAIVRPGPIQGGMVHPYLKAREHPERITYPSKALEGVLKRTLGVPIFQEQVMKIAMVAAGFSGDEANGLRRSMAAWKKKGGLEPWRDRLKSGMVDNGYKADFADRIFEQIKGFGSYGFPESHAVSFALLVYVSSYLKRHYPAAFCAALLNSQPMGFYAPAQLVRDARGHGVDVRPPDVRFSDWDSSLESTPGMPLLANDPNPALRLGLRQIKGLAPEASQRIVAARQQAPLADIQDLVNRARLDRRARDALARADALAGLAGHRHQAQWQIAAASVHDDLFAGLDAPEPAVSLPTPREGADIVADYQYTGLSLRRHPLALLRPRLHQAGAMNAQQFSQCRQGQSVHVAGIVTMRQRPGSAKGVAFVTLEDETGYVNVVVRPETLAEYRIAVLSARLLRVIGTMQRVGSVQHCVAHQVIDETLWLGNLKTRSRDFR